MAADQPPRRSVAAVTPGNSGNRPEYAFLECAGGVHHRDSLGSVARVLAMVPSGDTGHKRQTTYC